MVFDVPAQPRDRWLVDLEGRGLDFVLEVHVGGDRKKDMVRHPEFYAQLGIAEYFVVDRARDRLHGWRLAGPGAQAYKPILSKMLRYRSEALDLELALEDGQLRFYFADAPLPLTRELAQRLERAVAQSEAMIAAEAAARQEEAAARQAEAAARLDAETRLAAALAELARLRGEKG